MQHSSSLYNTPSSSLPVPLESSTTRTVVNGNGKEMKVVVKEVLKHTAACEACRTRKRKCDGVAPCTYCVSKKQECIFAAPKKRGPVTKKRPLEEAISDITSLGAAQYESQLLDILEGDNLYTMYGNFAKLILPLSHNDIMHPRNITHKIQSYIALAYVARLGGIKMLANKYISQARLLSGSIYDRPEVDAVAAMAMFGMYWNLTCDFTLSRYYYHLAIGILQMMPPKLIKGKLGLLVTNLKLCSDQDLLADKDLLSRAFTRASDSMNSNDDRVCKAFLDLGAAALSVLGLNLTGLYPELLAKKFNAFDSLVVSEEGRMRIHTCLSNIRQIAEMFLASEVGPTMNALFSVDCPLFLMVVELQSNHVEEGIKYANSLLSALQNLNATESLGITNKMSMQIMLGAGCKLLHKAGYTNLAMQIFEHVKIVCKQMEPDYNILLTNTEFALDGTQATNPIFLPHCTITPIPDPAMPTFPDFFDSFFNSPVTTSPSSTSPSSSPLPSDIQFESPLHLSHLPPFSSSSTPSPLSFPQVSPTTLLSQPPPPLSSSPSSSSHPYLSFDSFENNDLENILQELTGREI